MLDGLFAPAKKGFDLLKQQKVAEAKECFAQVAAKKSNCADAFLGLAKCSFIDEQYEDTKANLHRALELDPSPEMINEILAITNWWMVSPPGFFNSSPAFSGSGNRLIYVSARQDTDGDTMINAFDRGGIYICDMRTGIEECIVPDTFVNSSPALSFDGRKAVYLSTRPRPGSNIEGDNPALYVMDLETRHEVQILDETNRVKYPYFTPDGNSLIFSSWRAGRRNSGVFMLNLSTMKLDMIVSDAYENAFPTISPRGDKVLFTSWRRDTNGDGAIDIRDNSGVFIKDLATKNETCLVSDECNNTFPSFSPDGNSVVYHSSRRDTNADGKIDSFDNPGIYVYDLQKNIETQVVEDSCFNKFSSFITAKNEVAFISARQLPAERQTNGYFEFKGVYLAGIQDKAVRRVLSEEFYGSRSLVASPGSNKIAYVSWHHASARGLYVASLDRLPSPKEMHAMIDANL